MKSSKNNKIRKWFRIIHRDLGFLMIGICLIYGISGILLNHMDGKDPAFKIKEETLKIEPELNPEELTLHWNDQQSLPSLNKVLSIDEDHLRLMLNGGIGVYNIKTGIVDYQIHKKNNFIYWINKLHYNKVKGWSIMADIFAVSLIFFAISGIVIVKGKKGFSGSGKWYFLIGIAIPVIYIILA